MTFQRILITLDGSTIAEKALDYVTSVAAPSSKITLLTVMTLDREFEAATFASSIGATFGMSYDTAMGHRAENLSQLEARNTYLKACTVRLEQAGYTVSIVTREGVAVDSILSVAREGFDLMIMVTHGRTGLSKLALGSITEAVLQHAPCPVLVIPAE